MNKNRASTIADGDEKGLGEEPPPVYSHVQAADGAVDDGEGQVEAVEQRLAQHQIGQRHVACAGATVSGGVQQRRPTPPLRFEPSISRSCTLSALKSLTYSPRKRLRIQWMVLSNI
jgi:hypothetical protein